MTTPEPLDETPAGGVEQRGGNSPVDYMPEDDAVHSWPTGTQADVEHPGGCGCDGCGCGA
jgi:hypothetical protein